MCVCVCVCVCVYDPVSTSVVLVLKFSFSFGFGFLPKSLLDFGIPKVLFLNLSFSFDNFNLKFQHEKLTTYKFLEKLCIHRSEMQSSFLMVLTGLNFVVLCSVKL